MARADPVQANCLPLRRFGNSRGYCSTVPSIVRLPACLVGRPIAPSRAMLGRLYARTLVGCLVSCIACGGDDVRGASEDRDGAAEDSRPDTLTFDPDMLEQLDAGRTESDAGERDSGPADDGGAAQSDQDASQPNPFASREPTNTPHGSMKYGGNEVGPNLKLLGSHLEITGSSPNLAITWYGRMRNDFADTLCAFAIDVRFLGSTGSELFTLKATNDLRPYMDGSSTASCAGPGEVFYLRGLATLTSGSPTLEDVYTISWTYRLAGFLDTLYPATKAALNDVAVEHGILGYSLSGTLKNKVSASLSFPSVVAYLLNEGGQPLARIAASTSSAIAGQGTWISPRPATPCRSRSTMPTWWSAIRFTKRIFSMLLRVALLLVVAALADACEPNDSLRLSFSFPDAGTPGKLGSFLSSCETGDDCPLGLCLEAGKDHQFCTKVCGDDGGCPSANNWTCGRTRELNYDLCLCLYSGPEVCGDGLDNDCNGMTDDCLVCDERDIRRTMNATVAVAGITVRTAPSATETSARVPTDLPSTLAPPWRAARATLIAPMTTRAPRTRATRERVSSGSPRALAMLAKIAICCLALVFLARPAPRTLTARISSRAARTSVATSA